MIRNIGFTKLQGCAHSFHLECLGDMNICPLCQSFLQNKVVSRDPWQKQQKLSAMLHPRKQASAKQDRQSNNVVNDQSDDDDWNKDWQYCWSPKGGERDYIYQWKNKILPGCLSPSTYHLVIFNSNIPLLTLELKELTLIHLLNYESGSHL